MKIQDFYGLVSAGNYGFVNLDTEGDTTLYLDFNFIRVMHNSHFDNERANNKILDFFSNSFELYRLNHKQQAISNFDIVAENNETHLGLSIKNDPQGQAPSADILDRIFSKMIEIDNDEDLFHGPLPMILFVYRFGPDYLSDLITNIIFEELYEFTTNTLESLGVTVVYGPKEKHYYWDIQEKQWKAKYTPTILINGKDMLLVPTDAVTKEYGFSAEDYVYKIIMKAVRENAINNSHGKKIPDKKKLLKDILDKNYIGFGKLKSFALDMTREHPEYLEQYYNKFGRFLNNNAEHLKDDNDLPVKKELGNKELTI